MHAVTPVHAGWAAGTPTLQQPPAPPLHAPCCCAAAPAVQRSLNKMVGQSSGYIESLPAPVQKRIEYLKELDGERAELFDRYRWVLALALLRYNFDRHSWGAGAQLFNRYRWVLALALLRYRWVLEPALLRYMCMPAPVLLRYGFDRHKLGC